MKIRLAYPKIPDTLNCPLRQCVAFEKLDGTNIHFSFSKDQWTGFGTRRDRFPYTEEGLFAQAHPDLKDVLGCDKNTLSELRDYLSGNPKYFNAGEILLFFEYCGPNSFAGQHQSGDEKHLYLIDVQIDGKILPPEEFLKDFDQFKSLIPKIIFRGKFSGQLFIDVRKGKYNLKEGVVVKGMVDDQIYMAKIKTEAYLERLKKEFKDNRKDFWE